MAVSVTHAFVSAIPDGDDDTLVRPSNWNEAHTVTGLGTAAEADTTDFATAAQGAKADSALQPAAIGVTVQAYDADLTAWAGVNPSSYSTTVEIAAAYQPLDTDLTTLAGLAKTDGGFIVGDGSAWTVETGSTARTSLGLGTAATVNTGTSGATVPLLNTDVTFSGTTLSLQNATEFNPQMIIRSDWSSVAAGFVNFRKTRSGGPTLASDSIGDFVAQATDTGSNFQNAASFGFSVTSVGASSVDGRINFRTADAGSLISELLIDGGLWHASVTGGAKGYNTINFGQLWYNGVQISPPGSPVTKTGDFTVAASEKWLIINKGSACTVTLPAASSFPGRELNFTNIGGAFATTSASSNVVPKAGGSAGTAILPATDGAWARLVSDSTNWVIMQAGT